MSNGDVHIGLIALGDNVVVGPNSHIGLGALLGSSSHVKALSVVQQLCEVEEDTTVMWASHQRVAIKSHHLSPP